MLEIFIFLQKEIFLERKTQLAVITHTNNSNGKKFQLFFGKSFGDDVILVRCPFNLHLLSEVSSNETGLNFEKLDLNL